MFSGGVVQTGYYFEMCWLALSFLQSLTALRLANRSTGYRLQVSGAGDHQGKAGQTDVDYTVPPSVLSSAGSPASGSRALAVSGSGV